MSHGSRLSTKSTFIIRYWFRMVFFHGILSICRFPFLVLFGKVLYFQKWYFSFHCPTGKSVHNEISPGVDGSDSGLLGFARQVADEVTEEMLVTSRYAT